MTTPLVLGDQETTKKEVDLQFKVVMLGDEGVGKTSLVQRFVKHTFGGKYLPTLGLDVSIKYLELEGKTIRVQIFDIAGQHLFRKFRSRYFTGAQGAIFTYDVTKPKTLSNLDDWVIELTSAVEIMPFILLGNKIDLLSSLPSETNEENIPSKLQELIEYELGAGWLATSAKTGKNVQDAFENLIKLIISKKVRLEGKEEKNSFESFKDSWKMVM